MDSENRSETEHMIRLLAFVYTPITLVLIVTLYFFMRIDVTIEDTPKDGGGSPAATLPNDLPGVNIGGGDTIGNAQVKNSSTTIMVFGDSITAGYGLDLKDSYPSVLERTLKDAGYDISVLNSGVSGDTTAGGLNRAEFAAAQKPDVVIVALGGNDMLRGIDPGSTRNNLAGTIEIFQRAGVRVVLAGMYAAENLGEAYVSQFNAIYPLLAKEFGVPLIPFLLDGVALDKTKNQADGIHPNKEGAQIIAEQNIFPKILPILSSDLR